MIERQVKINLCMQLKKTLTTTTIKKTKKKSKTSDEESLWNRCGYTYNILLFRWKTEMTLYSSG